MKRRDIFRLGSLGATAHLGNTWAQKYPNGNISVILPLQAGSASDVAVRHMCERLAQKMGVGFVVENVAAAAGVVGLEKAAKAKADGQTIAALNNSIMTILPHLQPQNVKIDTRKEFLPVVGIANIPTFFAVPKDSPIKSVKDLVALAKARARDAKPLNYSSGGVGSPQHLATELLKGMTNTKMTHVPYRGASQAALAVATHEVDVMSMALSLALPFLPDGKVRFIGYCGMERHPQFRDIPTVHEQGVLGYEYSSWIGLFLHKDAPVEALAALRKEANSVAMDRSFQTQLIRAGLDPWHKDPAQLTKIIEFDYNKWQRAIALIKIPAA